MGWMLFLVLSNPEDERGASQQHFIFHFTQRDIDVKRNDDVGCVCVCVCQAAAAYTTL